MTFKTILTAAFTFITSPFYWIMSVITSINDIYTDYVRGVISEGSKRALGGGIQVITTAKPFVIGSVTYVASMKINDKWYCLTSDAYQIMKTISYTATTPIKYTFGVLSRHIKDGRIIPYFLKFR